ncbi:hypothetical protein KPL71_021655 [Citrus sinensis]|uniref:Uncharacterized protein n=1 Tax=Citrus sinensis TaxID=2711 RepID=A0ACB8JHF5_CITSI|nr:hypothetical protein KPL71_021655 [Citrus sinensis]
MHLYILHPNLNNRFTTSFFGFFTLQPTPQAKPSSPKKSKSKVKISKPKSKATSSSSIPPVPPEDSPKVTPEPSKKDKGPMDQYHYHTVQNTSFDSSEPEPIYKSNPSESNPSSSSSSTNQAAPTEPEPSMPPPVSNHSTKPSSASWFTFDDIPRHKWLARLQEFAAWIDLQGTKPNAQPESVLREFVARLTGSLRDWLESLGEYRQIQFMQAPIATALTIIHEQFIEQSSQDDQTAFILAESSDSDDISIISTVQNVNQVSTIPRPSLKMFILPSKFHKPVPVIGFIDTGADTSIIDPSVLPSDCWENHSKLFKAVNGETFETNLITKKSIDWACQAFYVEKRSELVRGKKRLVIDYQPLNSFLKGSMGLLLKSSSKPPSSESLDFRRRENFSFMSSTSSSIPSPPVTLSSTLSLPKSCSSHTTNKIENLVEYSYIPESAQISESSYPLLSPYHLYKRPSSFTRSIRTLISTRHPHPKEYIQSSRLDQCSLQATPAEQYVTLEIPSELISNWKREGYTHLHLGGIRLILTLHGRKGLPVAARIAMLDTRFKQYQDVVIGTVLTTLHAGSVLLTFYPNFNLSIQDTNLPTALKVQVQIQVCFISRELKSFIIMASSSQNPVQLSSSMSLPKTVTKHTTSKIESLVEYSYIRDSAQVNESSLPLVNPYQLYQRPSRFTRSIHSFISTSRSTPKEYIQSSSLDQCSLQSTSAEQYVTLEISPELISHWKQQRYTHFHLGGVRLILTLHGRKGLPVTAHIALLDTRFKQYEQATIGTVLTTLHAGSVVLTVYPNFNLSLDDPNLSTFLKIQVQIQGAEQVSSAKIATIHHQLVYRLQNHSLILPTPPDLSSDTLMILAESPDIPTIIQIPRQIPRADLLKIMPLEWITTYEHFHQNTTPVQTSEPMYEKRPDGSVRLQFKPPPSAPAEPPRLSFTCSMVQPVDIIPEDVPGSGRCDSGCPCNDDEDDYSSRPKKKNIIYPACKLYLPEDDDDEPDYPPPLPLYNKGLQWIQKHQPRSCKPVRSSVGLLPTPPMVPCMMFSSASASASDYSSEYPPLEKHSDQKHQNARVQNASLTSLHSKVDQIAHRSSAVETSVTSLSDQLTNLYNSLHAKVAQLDRDLRAMIARGDNSYEFTRKEQEIRQLQAEIARIDADNQQRQAVHTAPPSYFPTEPYHPLGSFFPTTPRDYTPEKVFPMTYHLNPQPAKPKPRPPRRPVPPPAVSIPPPVHSMYSDAIQKPLQIHEPVFPDLPSTSALPPFTESPSKAEQKKPAENYLITAPELDQLNSSSEESSPSDSVETFDSITETSEPNNFSSDDSPQHLTDISRLLMADHAESTTTDPPPREPGQPYVDIPSDVEGENEGDNSNPPPRVRTKVAFGNGPWFTFDDLPPARWRERLQELSAWLDLQMVKPDAELSAVLKEFVSRFTGSLHDWFDSLGQYRQLLYLQHPTVSAALMDIHSQFLGEPAAIFATARKEYLQMRCCSMQRSDLHYHFKRMSALFHKIGGINDHTLKHVFLSSLPEELQPEIRRQIANAQLDINNLSLGRLFQLALVSLDYLCDQKKFFRNLMKEKEGFRTACKKPYLEIKCRDSKHCTCPSTKKHHKVRFHKKSSRTPQSRPFPRRPKKIRAPQNARAQNDTLLHLNSKVEKINF